MFGGSEECRLKSQGSRKMYISTRKEKLPPVHFFSSEARWFAISFTLVEEDRKNRAGHESCCGSLHANPLVNSRKGGLRSLLTSCVWRNVKQTTPPINRFNAC